MESKESSNGMKVESTTIFYGGNVHNKVHMESLNRFDSAQQEISFERHMLESRWKEQVCSHLERIAVQGPQKSTSRNCKYPSIKSDIYLYHEPKNDAHLPLKHQNSLNANGLPTREFEGNDSSGNLVVEPGHIAPRFQMGDLLCSFSKRPSKVLLVIRRPTLNSSLRHATNLCNHLTENGITVICEPESSASLAQAGASNISTWREGVSASQLCHHLDVVIVMGGDGTMLDVSHLFSGAVPPVLGVAMGTLGYLSPFRVEEVQSEVDRILCQDTFQVQLRCRLRACINDENGRRIAEFPAMNDCVIDRGECSQLTVLEIYCNGYFFTSVSADGLIIATPTGSTAYSMSAGGSMVHPRVPCMLFTPICPHTLSFRPVILPDSVELLVVNSWSSRGAAWCSLDGRNRMEIKNKMSVSITMSAFPIPLIVPRRPDDSWLRSLKRILKWNQRVRQGEFEWVDMSSSGKGLLSSMNSEDIDNAYDQKKHNLKERNNQQEDSLKYRHSNKIYSREDTEYHHDKCQRCLLHRHRYSQKFRKNNESDESNEEFHEDLKKVDSVSTIKTKKSVEIEFNEAEPTDIVVGSIEPLENVAHVNNSSTEVYHEKDEINSEDLDAYSAPACISDRSSWKSYETDILDSMNIDEERLKNNRGMMMPYPNDRELRIQLYSPNNTSRILQKSCSMQHIATDDTAEKNNLSNVDVASSGVGVATNTLFVIPPRPLLKTRVTLSRKGTSQGESQELFHKVNCSESDDPSDNQDH